MGTDLTPDGADREHHARPEKEQGGEALRFQPVSSETETDSQGSRKHTPGPLVQTKGREALNSLNINSALPPEAFRRIEQE